MRLSFATLPLLIAATLMGYLLWTGGSLGPLAPGAGAVPGAEPRVAQTELRLWEAEPAAADPMGPTTARLLSLLEGES